MGFDYHGVHVPLITPFNADFSVDEKGYRTLCRHYLDKVKAQGLVPCGTTGESPTLSGDEKRRLIQIAVEEGGGKVPVMAGTGTNSTASTIEMTKAAEKLGADSCLVVGPYYNKPTPEGMLAHFKAVAASTSLPIFIYNIPGRTSKNIEPKTIIELAKIENIAGLQRRGVALDEKHFQHGQDAVLDFPCPNKIAFLEARHHLDKLLAHHVRGRGNRPMPPQGHY